MKLLMHVLKKNNQLKIDNSNVSIGYMIKKLEEESLEVTEAFLNYGADKTLNNLKEIIRESFDVIQVCILILWRSNIEARSFDKNNLVQEINIEHKDKLVDRGWIIETGIQIEVKE